MMTEVHDLAMPEPRGANSRGLLLVTVWVHEGRLVARVRAADSLDEEAYDVGVEVGSVAIAAAVEQWLGRLDPEQRRDAGNAPAATER